MGESKFQKNSMKFLRRIYPLENLSPEQKAVTFAKCSRSPLPFSEIAKKLTKEEAEKFNKKWVIDFGHASIAEHAVISLAVENVSILATKIIEDTRFASFTEKSTRYQVFEKDKYYFPDKIKNSALADLYQRTIEGVMVFYLESYKKIFPIIQKENPIKPEMSEKFYLSQIKAKTCDIVRSILPVATLTNLGMTINARSLGHLIVKMLSHPLEESQEIGKELKEAAISQLPSLISWVKENEFLKETPILAKKISKKYLKNLKKREKNVELVDFDEEAENKIINSLFYRVSGESYQEISKKIKKLPLVEKNKILGKILAKRKPMEPVPREFEQIYYTFDILIDYGAFRDLQRHRVCTQINQELTNKYGYQVSEEIEKYGLAKEFEKKMKETSGVYEKIVKKFPVEAQYILPLAFRKRLLMKLNLRELFYLVPLRTSVMAHPSYRLIVQQMYQAVENVHPYLAKFIKIFR